MQEKFFLRFLGRIEKFHSIPSRKCKKNFSCDFLIGSKNFTRSPQENARKIFLAISWSYRKISLDPLKKMQEKFFLRFLDRIEKFHSIPSRKCKKNFSCDFLVVSKNFTRSPQENARKIFLAIS